ncbi:ATP-binding protein [Paraconexibacter antarcticus]|uniref:ATP-binding protein n=1 Tax=Paraconexibacter antarcticus TaxID=2949664 RepID=A0ABY5DQC5_9ACTN|nr:ATP-binding protein [Paraconexibacter antarcticus]UTI63106.1 ATP-binding protein [Paraconexibacter antarcticus]
MSEDLNPFRFGSLALDEAFTDREAEIAELVADVRNGQDVVVLAPRRFGKTSLVWRASQELMSAKVLVAQVNLMTTPTPAKLADKLARAIHDDVASAVVRAKDRLKIFQGLRVRPTVTIDPDDGTPSFSFELGGAAAQDVSDTLERLLELPARLAAERGRRVALVFDEFQEIVDIDPGLPRLMRSVFQEQPDVSHVYLGSRRHMMRRLFSDEQEPFWRSAKQIDLGVIPPELFAPFLVERFAGTERELPGVVADALLGVTHGHPYATQELAYFLWQEVPHDGTATPERLDTALEKVLRSEHAHFSLLWERAPRAQRQVLQALAAEPGRVTADAYRSRHRLPAASSVQRATETLERDEVVLRDEHGVHICEPFLAQWLRAAR